MKTMIQVLLLTLLTISSAQCTASCEGGCTLTQGFWKNHPSAWPEQYKDATLCGVSFAAIWEQPPSGGNSWVQLAHQYQAAVLNVASGACITSCLNQTLHDAEEFLTSNCGEDGQIPFVQSDHAVDLAFQLDNYNNGREGSGGPYHCDEPPPVDQCDLCNPGNNNCSWGSCGCTFTQGAWQQKFGQGGNANKKTMCVWPHIPSESCDDFSWLQLAALTEDTLICTGADGVERTWLWALEHNPSDSEQGWGQLAQQWVAATLNLLNGACANCPTNRDECAQVWDAVKAGYEVLKQCQGGDEAIHSLLGQFNEGDVGPGHCGEDEGVGENKCCSNCGKVSQATASRLAEAAGFSTSCMTSASSRVGLF